MSDRIDEPSLIAAARRGLAPTAADRERVRRATLAAVAPGGGAPTKAAGEMAAPRSSSWAVRVTAVGVVAAAAAGVGYGAGLRAGREQVPTPIAARLPPTARASGAPDVLPPAAPPPPVVPAAERSRPATRHRVTTDAAAAAIPAVPTASLAEEVSALRAVERALREGSPGFALSLLRELDRKVPNGRLHEERMATLCIARCASGDVPLGVNLSDDFADRYPDSVYGRRVFDACARTDSPRAGDSSTGRSSHDED